MSIIAGSAHHLVEQHSQLLSSNDRTGSPFPGSSGQGEELIDETLVGPCYESGAAAASEKVVYVLPGTNELLTVALKSCSTEP